MKSRNIILVVDDMPGSLSMLTAALEDAGMTVLVAQEGGQALSTIEKITPDIVLMDAVMPEMDGFETCRRLKAMPQGTDLPVVFMTGLSETEHVVKGLEAGGVDYVTKPIVIRELLARIRVHLANAHMTRSARMALDATGRFLLAVNRAGTVLWATPQASDSLAQGYPQTGAPHTGDILTVPAAAEAALRRLVVSPHGEADNAATILPATRPGCLLQAAYVGQVGTDEFLLRLSEGTPLRDEEILSQRLKITAREAEVLLWLAHGKANRDIAEILGLSPRTVDKHLEQVYTKLGVENRTAAAACAMRVLGER